MSIKTQKIIAKLILWMLGGGLLVFAIIGWKVTLFLLSTLGVTFLFLWALSILNKPNDERGGQ